MKMIIDTEANTLAVEQAGKASATYDLYSCETLAEISRQWVRGRVELGLLPWVHLDAYACVAVAG